MKRFGWMIFGLLLTINSQAQAANTDFFRSIGKIYTVFGTLVLILVGIFVFLFMIERRLSRLEKERL